MLLDAAGKVVFFHDRGFSLGTRKHRQGGCRNRTRQSADRRYDKDRNRRYPTPLALAEDIGRHLEGLPVEACPPRRLYRLRKRAWRHRVAVAAGAAVFIALAAGLVATGLALRRAWSAERGAVTEARLAREVVDLTDEMLGAANPHEVRGPNFTVRQFLGEFDARLAGQLHEQPLVEARLRLTVGRAYRSLGLLNEAEAHLQAATELHRQHLGEGHEYFAESLAERSWLQHARGQHAPAERTVRHALEVLRQCAPAGPGMLSCLQRLADYLSHQGHHEEAELRAREALALAAKLGDDERPAFEIDAKNALAVTLRESGRAAAAEPLHREVLAALQALRGEHPDTAASMNQPWPCC